MIPILLAIALSLLAIGGLAWSARPLVGPSRHGAGADLDADDLEVERALDLLDDVESERARGVLTTSEYESSHRELRYQAAAALKARTDRTERLDRLVEEVVSDSAATPDPGAAAPPATAYVSADRRLRWLIPAGSLIVGLIAVVVIVTLGARGTRGAQTVVGRVQAAGITAVAADRDDPDLLAASHPAGIQVSDDGGVTWRAADLSPPVRSVAATARGLLAVGEDTLYRSAAGDRWEALAGGSDIRLAAEARSSERLVAITADDRVVESRDGGRSWSAVAENAPSNATGLAVVDRASPQILVSTLDEGVLALGSDGRWRGANGFVNGALPTVTARALWYEPDSGDRFTSATGARFEGAIYVATDVGVFKTVDGAQAWTRLGLSADIVGIAGSAADPRSIYAVARDGSVYRSRDAGVTWT